MLGVQKSAPRYIKYKYTSTRYSAVIRVLRVLLLLAAATMLYFVLLYLFTRTTKKVVVLLIHLSLYSYFSSGIVAGTWD